MSSGSGGLLVAQVLLDSSLPQLDHVFDYEVPSQFVPQIRVGHRVKVPLRSQTRQSYGWVIALTDSSAFTGKLQTLSEIVSPYALLTPDVWHTARAAADRAAGSASDILRLAIPQRMVRAEKSHVVQREITQATDYARVAETFAVEHSETIARMLLDSQRMAVSSPFGVARLSTGEWVSAWAQELAYVALSVFSRGNSVIIVVPDYRDIDQLNDVLAAAGHTETVRLDSRQSGSARYASFLKALDPVPRIIIGNRSTAYAPAHNLGAMLVWDDGDPLFAEPLSPYVNARDACLIRSSQQNIGLAFFAHSRSIEVQRLVQIGYCTEVHSPVTRARVVASEQVVNTELFSSRVPEFAAKVIREGVQSGPVLVQVAAPGYSPAAACAQCGEKAMCAHCFGPLRLKEQRVAVCRWCGQHTTAWQCQHCESHQMSARGVGSQRTVEQFRAQFDGVPIVLSDGNNPHSFVDSRPSIVVATRGAEPIAAGGYRAVVLLDAARLLSIESLSVGEDCLRWWQNAISFAAPDATCVIAEASGPVVNAFVNGRINDWLREELLQRKQLRFVPMVRAASVSGAADVVSDALAAVQALPGVDVLGPVPEAQHNGTDDTVRAIVRFDYASGAEVAATLRAKVVADAAGSSSKTHGRAMGRPRAAALKLKFDDRHVFDE